MAPVHDLASEAAMKRPFLHLVGVVAAAVFAAIAILARTDRQRAWAMLGALVLWFHYGTAVFFEMIASGISSCF